MNKLLLLLIIVILISGCVSQEAPEETTIETTTTAVQTTVASEEIPDEPGKCSEPITFDYPPADLDKVLYILPLGAMMGGHVTPVDHQYYRSQDDVWIDVYSPAEGVITSIQHMGTLPGDGSPTVDDYRLEIVHTCTISSVFIHIDEVSDKIMEIAPPLNEFKNVEMEVEAGEVLGRYTGSLDYNVVDYDVFLTGFVIPESYNEKWKMHIPDPFDYFNEPVKSQLIGLCLRSAEPVGGKIDYDIEGKLVGTWFLENTNKYGGLTGPSGAYHTGHLTIAYDSIDPDYIIVSIGDFDGEARQFGVVGNSPDPKDVGVETGMVKYELVDFVYYDGDKWWDNYFVKGLKIRPGEDKHGIALFQVLEDNKLRVETFPGKRPSQVNDFTEAALTYER